MRENCAQGEPVIQASGRGAQSAHRRPGPAVFFRISFLKKNGARPLIETRRRVSLAGEISGSRTRDADKSPQLKVRAVSIRLAKTEHESENKNN